MTDIACFLVRFPLVVIPSGYTPQPSSLQTTHKEIKNIMSLFITLDSILQAAVSQLFLLFYQCLFDLYAEVPAGLFNMTQHLIARLQVRN